MSAPTPDAALDALADALAPRLFDRLKKLAAEEVATMLIRLSPNR